MTESGISRIAVIVGTRPEIVKLASIVRLLGDDADLIHTGQHEDEELSGAFLSAHGLTSTRALTGICGQPRHVQVGQIIEQLGGMLSQARPAAVLVQGDTNTASAGAQAANYAGVPVIHVEAGLRSRDRAMPEEINRCVAGVLADLHCAPTAQAVANLRAEGVPEDRIALTGNTIVEVTERMLPEQRAARQIAADLGAEPGGYVLATIHRPENTAIAPAGGHPGRAEQARPARAAAAHPGPGWPPGGTASKRRLDRLRVIPPADHRTFLALASQARLLVSDSGGVQEECTVLKRPLIVVRGLDRAAGVHRRRFRPPGTARTADRRPGPHAAGRPGPAPAAGRHRLPVRRRARQRADRRPRAGAGGPRLRAGGPPLELAP